MPWVYLLKGSSGRHYLGSTTDLGRRLEQHRRGHTHTTRRLGESLELIASAELPTLEQARTTERKLKSWHNPAKAAEFLRAANQER